MENAIYIGLSRQIILQSQMDMVANNIANMNTPGYRGQNMLFREYVTDPKGQGPAYSMVKEAGQFTSTAPGVNQTTGAPLDVALVGPGFFTISTPQGPRYTRAGSFTMNNNGDIVTPSGDLVGSTAITVPADSKEIHIDQKGVVSTENGPIGQLQIVEFANTDQLTREGNGLYNAGTATPITTQNTKTIQGMVEGSNIQGVVEMTKMIGILREYQSVQRMLQSEHDLQRNTIQRLTGGNA